MEQSNTQNKDIAIGLAIATIKGIKGIIDNGGGVRAGDSINNIIALNLPQIVQLSGLKGSEPYFGTDKPQNEEGDLLCQDQ